MHHTWDALLAQAARNTVLRPGDVHRLGHGRQRLHPRARRRPLAAARRRRRARDRGHRRAAEHGRVIGPDDVRAAARVLDGVAHRTPVVTLAHARRARRAEAREPAARRRVQVPRRVQQDRVARRAARRVLAFSSGNHAQAVALAARLLGAQATILMPEDAPRVEARGDAAATAPRSSPTTATPSDREAIAAALAAERGARARAPLRRPADHGRGRERRRSS